MRAAELRRGSNLGKEQFDPSFWERETAFLESSFPHPRAAARSVPDWCNCDEDEDGVQRASPQLRLGTQRRSYGDLSHHPELATHSAPEETTQPSTYATHFGWPSDNGSQDFHRNASINSTAQTVVPVYDETPKLFEVPVNGIAWGRMSSNSG